VADLNNHSIIGIGAKPPPHLTTSSAVLSGTCLHFADDWSTVTKIDVLRPIVVSGNFSGCAYKVFRGEGAVICAHIARPGGVGADANVDLMDSYAQQKGWIEIQHMPTAGHIGQNGCTEVVAVSQLVAGRIDTILLEINNQGLTVGTNYIATPL
jgi:hypothetical protein